MSLVLLDIWLPGEDGMAILRNLRNEQPELPVIMMSGHAGIEAAVSAITVSYTHLRAHETKAKLGCRLGL
mgnify:CR=1 FL=1